MPSSHFQYLSQLVNVAIEALPLPSEPSDLYDPARYILASGGKRIRPVCTLLAAEIFGVSAAKAMPVALSIEVFHNFTLVHDDIMDKADSRRNRPTVHRKWNEPVAILSGDLLMGQSYALLAEAETKQLAAMILRFQVMVQRLCEGQTLDMAFETRFDVTVSDYLEMISGKTAALLEAAFVLGGMMGEADKPTLDRLQELGKLMGIGFQIQDDLLDLTAEKADFGKTIGGDLIQGKRTWLLLTAIERAEGNEKRWFEQILQSGLPQAEISTAKVKMEALGVLADAKKIVDSYYQNAISCIQHLPSGQASATLIWLIETLVARNV